MVLFILDLFVELTATLEMGVVDLEVSVKVMLDTVLLFPTLITELLPFVWFTDAAVVVFAFTTKTKANSNRAEYNIFRLIIPPPRSKSSKKIISEVLNTGFSYKFKVYKVCYFEMVKKPNMRSVFNLIPHLTVSHTGLTE